MITLVTILILLACVVLAFFILVQNPKGGGLTGAFGSIGSQVMGVKQSTDVMEKGTWTSMGIIAALCIVSILFYSSPRERQQAPPQSSGAPAQQQVPAGGNQNSPQPGQ
jgi:preprotein translocase subunit SecG